MNLWGPLGVARFELRRSLSAGRLSLWLLVALFPMALVVLVHVRNEAVMAQEMAHETMLAVLFFLIVRVACVLGLLLWATPVIHSEIEAQSWIYAATRPAGTASIVLGKYAVAVLWSFTAGAVATVVAVPISGVEDPFWAWAVLTALVGLAVLAYGALFTFIGTMIQRRAMVVAILYIVLIEGALSLVPATINQFTVGFRLLSLLVHWMGLDEKHESEQLRMLFGESAPLTHFLVLLIYTLALLAAALLRARRGGYQVEPED